MADYWKIKTDIMWAILVPWRKSFQECMVGVKSRYVNEGKFIDGYIDETGLGDQAQRQAFQQEFGSYFYRQTGIGIRGLVSNYVHPNLPDTVEKLKKYHDLREKIAEGWNRQNQRKWWVSYLLIVRLVDKEIRRLEYNAEGVKRQRPSNVGRPGAGDVAERDNAQPAVKNEPVHPVKSVAEAADKDETLATGGKASVEKAAGENPGRRPPLTLINGGGVQPGGYVEVEKHKENVISGVAGRSPVGGPAEGRTRGSGAAGGTKLSAPPEELLLQRGRAWLKDLHVVLGVKDQEAAQIQSMQQQILVLGQRASLLEQEKGRLEAILAGLGQKSNEINSRWAHMETLAAENRRLEEELAGAREDALADFFREMLEKNPCVERILLGPAEDADISLAGLVEHFRHQGLRPLLPRGRMGEKIKLGHSSREYRPLDFAFTGDGEVEAQIAHPGLAYRGRVLVLPGVQRPPDQGPKV